MNKTLLKNILLFQDKIEPLDKGLFNSFVNDLMQLYDFLTKEKDIFVNKEETKEKLKNNSQFVETFQNINALNNLEISRDTKFELFKHILENNTPNNDKSICMFSIYFLWSKEVKLLQKQQKEILEIIKKDKGRNFLNSGSIVLNFLMISGTIGQKAFLKNMKSFQFEVFHELNKEGQIQLNELKDNDFMHYVINQFATYNLKIPMTLQKNTISLSQAVQPYLEQGIDKEKKTVLTLILDLMRDSLKLDNENNEFLDKLVLNTKLNEKEVTNKVKKLKI